jgi:D-alanyl-D-alanine carboxypeptidase
VISSDGSVWEGTAGENGDETPIGPNTVFNGASTTKCHVATLCMLLVEDGLLDLDASWTTYVDIDADFSEIISARHLLSHTSGIADYLETGSIEATIFDDPSYQFEGQYILEEIVNPNPSFQPGEDFSYSNSNYALLGLIIESVTSNTVAEELRSRIWDVLGLEHTYFGGFEDYSETKAGVWWNFGSGLNNYSSDDHTAMLSVAYCAGNIVSTPKDEAIFLEALLGGNIVSQTSLDQMHEFIPESFSAWSEGYGLGLHHATSTGSDEVLGHDGYYTNMTSMFHSTNCDFTIVTMTNTFSTWYGVFAPLYNILSNNCIVEVDESIPQTTFEIAPNPTTGLIQISGLPEEDSNTYKVYDFKGALLDEGVLFGAYAQMDLSMFGSGLYLVMVGEYAQRVFVE